MAEIVAADRALGQPTGDGAALGRLSRGRASSAPIRRALSNGYVAAGLAGFGPETPLVKCGGVGRAVA
jgi:hypothetical protein